MKHKTYQCTAISLIDREDIDSFTVLPYEGEGLLNYLQSCALQDEEEHLARTYIVRNFDVVPGIELSNFAFMPQNGRDRW